MTYLEYIYSNASLIGVNHPSFQIRQLYQKKRKAIEDINNPTFVSLCHELWEKDINRQFVKEAVRKDLYAGFLTTMLWGGQGLGPGNSWNNIVKTMSCPKKVIETKLIAVKRLLEQNQLSQAFNSLNNGKNKIPGVGISYFTKILFYLGLNIETCKQFPLIFDKWGQYIHAALLIDDKKENVTSWYRIYTDDHGFHVNARNPHNAYIDYIQRLCILGNDDKLKIKHPGDLEEYLFGRDLKNTANKNNSNPRFFVREYVKLYYDTTLGDSDKSYNNRKKHNTSLKDSVRPIPTGKRVLERTIEYGYEFNYDGRIYYLIAGKKKSFAYCALLLKGNNDINSFAHILELEQHGFNKKKSNYIYKKYRLEETPLAIAEVDSLLKEWGLK